MTDKETISYLRRELRWKSKALKRLAKFYEATQEALENEKQGHTIGWDRVQALSDDLEDDFDMVSMGA